MSSYYSLFFPDVYPKVRIILNVLVRFKELILRQEDEAEGAERRKIIRKSEPDRPFQNIYFKYYYRQSPRLLREALWYPDPQDWGAFYSIKTKPIPQHHLRLDCDGSYEPERGGFGFVLRDSGYNPLFGGCGRSTRAVSSFYHEVEAIYQGLVSVASEGWTSYFLEIYSDNKNAIQLIRRYNQLNENEIRELGYVGPLVGEINRLLQMVSGGYKLDYHYREGNFVADYLSKIRGDIGIQYLRHQEFAINVTLAYFVNRDRRNLDWRTAKPYLRYDKYTLEWLSTRAAR